MGELSRQKFSVQGERSRLAKLGIVELITCLHLGLFSVHMDKTNGYAAARDWQLVCLVGLPPTYRVCWCSAVPVKKC